MSYNWKFEKLVMSLCVHAVLCFHSTTCIAFENLHKYGEKDGGWQGNEIYEWCRMVGNKPIDSKIDGIGHGARELLIASWFGFFLCFWPNFLKTKFGQRVRDTLSQPLGACL